MRRLVSLFLILSIIGCSGSSSSPVHPGEPEGTTGPIHGTYTSLPRHPHVEVVIDSAGAWRAEIWSSSTGS